MAMAWISNEWARAWASYCQGVESPWHINLAQKDTRRLIKLQKTPKDGVEHREGEAYAQGTGDGKTRRKPLGTGRRLGRRSSPAGGGSDVRVMVAVRGMKGPSDGRTLGAYMDLDIGQVRQRGDNRTRDGSHRLTRGKCI